MKRLLELTDEYIATLRTEDIAVLKVCLLTFGILFGLTLPKKLRRPMGYAACGVFSVTYLASFTPFLRFLRGRGIEMESLFE